MLSSENGAIFRRPVCNLNDAPLVADRQWPHTSNRFQTVTDFVNFLFYISPPVVCQRDKPHSLLTKRSTKSYIWSPAVLLQLCSLNCMMLQHVTLRRNLSSLQEDDNACLMTFFLLSVIKTWPREWKPQTVAKARL